jgi:hypothetical protein
MLGAALLSPIVGLLPAIGHAQPAATVDVGGAVLRYADTLRATAVTVAPAVRAGLGPATLAAYGTGSRLDAGDWSVQGGLDAAVASPALGPVFGELAGSAAGSAHRDGTRTGETRGIGRLYLVGWRGGLWAGGGLGRTDDGLLWRDVRLAEAGLWGSFGPATLSAAVTPTTVDDTLRYTDVEAVLQLAMGDAEMDVSGGVRSGAAVLTTLGGDRAWGGASVTYWLGTRFGVVAAAGTYPVSPTQGFPGGRYATLGVRLASKGARPAPAPAAPTPGEQATAELSDFSTSAAAGGQRTLRVRAPRARTVEVAGDFTAWAPVAMKPEGSGWWAATLPIPAGVHQVNLRLDGSAWRTPPALPSVADEFGGRVGLLVIEREERR